MGVAGGGEDDRVMVDLARTGTLSPARAAELEAKAGPGGEPPPGPRPR